jgi:hypothetical protein
LDLNGTDRLPSKPITHSYPLSYSDISQWESIERTRDLGVNIERREDLLNKEGRNEMERSYFEEVGEELAILRVGVRWVLGTGLRRTDPNPNAWKEFERKLEELCLLERRIVKEVKRVIEKGREVVRKGAIDPEFRRYRLERSIERLEWDLDCWNKARVDYTQWFKECWDKDTMLGEVYFQEVPNRMKLFSSCTRVLELIGEEPRPF